MLNELLKSNQVPSQTDIEHPLNKLGVSEFLKPKSGKDIFGPAGSAGGNAIRRKLLQASGQMNDAVLSKMKARLLKSNTLNQNLVSIVGKAPEEDLTDEEDKPLKESVEEIGDGNVQPDYDILEDFEPTDDLTDTKGMPMWHDCKHKYECLENFIGTLGPGCGFGEMAMQLDGKAQDRCRNYSAIAMQNTLLVQFSKAEFDRIIFQKERATLEHKKSFLLNTETFRDKPRAFLMKMSKELETREVIKDEIICREGAPFDYVYFIKSGEFQVTKKCKMPASGHDGYENADQIRENLGGKKDTM